MPPEQRVGMGVMRGLPMPLEGTAMCQGTPAHRYREGLKQRFLRSSFVMGWNKWCIKKKLLN